MGALDDAIREHLELKRRQGVSEEELKRKEDEAFGRAGAAWQASAPAAPTTEAAPPEAQPPEPEEEVEPAPDEDFEPVPEGPTAAQPPIGPLDEIEISEERSLAETEIEPDEVLPEEALELDRENGEVTDEALEDAPDFLEETPDFLDEEASEQDQLWFERKPPKDFDFDS
jgi:hypothetical protein